MPTIFIPSSYSERVRGALALAQNLKSTHPELDAQVEECQKSLERAQTILDALKQRAQDTADSSVHTSCEVPMDSAHWQEAADALTSLDMAIEILNSLHRAEGDA